MTDRIVWLHEPGAYQYLGYESDEQVLEFRNEYYEGYSDAVWLNRWSYWGEWDYTIEWYDHDGGRIDPRDVHPLWRDVAYVQVRPQPGVIVRGKYEPPPFMLSSTAKEHLISVARGPVIDATFEGHDTPCSKIINFQIDNYSGRCDDTPWADRFQVPTPWIGRIDEAPILFLGANPSIGSSRTTRTDPAPRPSLLTPSTSPSTAPGSGSRTE